MNIFVLDRNYRKIGVLSNQGANPKAPYFDDLYTQELDTGADTYYFSTLATYYAQDIIEIGNHVVFEFNNKQKMFVISSLEFEHRDGMNTIGVYAEGAGFELLEMYKKDIKIENCTYAQLLDNILAGTGWKYKVSSSLSKETRDVDYTQEKNVYALLQDSIQTFQGVELEFITDYRDGSPVKTIRAYGNGERGTFVGKRFEYGKNVKGIVKTQEVSNIKDENVIFNEGLIIIDGLRVEVTYDIDFALRSEEVTELNIGDTHYIIDNDFNPSMNIKGRIGKIEISFSDPTKNKIYIANFKKATGSGDDDDDNNDDPGDGDDPGYGEVGPHDHDRLVNGDKIVSYTSNGCLIPNTTDEQWIGLPNKRWGGACIESIYADDIQSTRVISCTYQLPFDREEMLDVSEITTTSGINKQDLLEFILNDVKIYKYMYKDKKAESEESGLSNTGTYLGILSESFVDHKSDNNEDCDVITVSKNIHSLIMRNMVSDTDNDGDLDDETTHESHTYNLPALVVALIGAFQQYANGGLPFDPDIYATIDFVDEWCSNLNLADAEIWKKIREIEAGNGGSIDLSNYATITYVDDKVGYMEDYVNNSHNRLNGLIMEKTEALEERVTELESSSGSNPSNPDDSNNPGSGGIDSEYIEVVNYTTPADKSDKKINMKKTTEIYGDLNVSSVEGSNYLDGSIFADGNIECYGNMNATIGHFQDVTADEFTIGIVDMKYFLDNGRDGIIFNGDIRMENNILYAKDVKTSSDKSLKENIRYIDNSVMITSDDSLEKADLHDFIVNQVNICEYNFIGDAANKIGFIANDYEGTKVGDKIVSRQGEDNTLAYDVNNLLFATIGALQEEVRIKDEKIASLEARLAKIEEMLGINNN